MKNLKHLLFSGLALMLALSSCTMEKRIYSSGYHIEWKKSKQNSDRQELGKKGNGKATEQYKIATFEQSDNEVITDDNFNSTTVIEANITASLDNTVILLSPKTVSLNKKDNIINAKIEPTAETKTVIPNKKELKNKLRELKSNNSSKDDDGNGGLRAIGWVVLILGIIDIFQAEY